MELVQGQVLASYYTHGEVRGVLEWALQNLWVKRRTDEAYRGVCDKFYRAKTLERVAAQCATMFTEALVVNGAQLRVRVAAHAQCAADERCQRARARPSPAGVRTGTVSDVLARVDWAALGTDTFCQFHGDFIMDNIIRTTDSYRLVDWRQDFGGDLEAGDMYYDLAKFRHNIIFNHHNVEVRHVCAVTGGGSRRRRSEPACRHCGCAISSARPLRRGSGDAPTSLR